MKIFNGTPHDINLFLESQAEFASAVRKLILKEGEAPVFVIPKGEKMLNAQKATAAFPAINSELTPFLKGGVIFTAVDPLPEGYDLYIVSALYKSAAKELGMDVSKLATIDGAVYDSEINPRPAGCTGLSVG